MLRFKYKEKDYQYPTSLSEISISQRIDFDHQYGQGIAARVKDLESMSEDMKKYDEIELMMEATCKSFSFFTGIPLEEVYSDIDLAQVNNVYSVSLAALLAAENSIVLQDEYEFEGETWVIQPPELKPKSEMTFNEFLTAKEVTRQLEQLGRGKWDALPYLACVYFRKKGEEFSEDLIQEDGPRYRLMENLPLDHALAVGFFLTDTMSLYLNILAFSNQEDQKE